MKHCFNGCLLFLLLALGLGGLLGQTPAPPAAPAPLPEIVGPPDKKETLRRLLNTRDALRKSLDELRKRLPSETSDSAKREVQEQIDALDKQRQQVERDFAVLATGLQEQQTRGDKSGPAPPPSLQEEISQLLTPVFTDLRQLSQKARRVQELEDEIAQLRDRETQASRAMAEIDKLLVEVKASKAPDTGLRTALSDSRKTWQARLDESKNRIAALQHQLTELRVTGIDFWTELGSNVKRFVFIRGTNIILALLVFIVVFFGLRTAYSYVLKVVPVRKYQSLGFTLRVLDVGHEGVSLLLGISAALLVLYARGDWLLGGLALLALGGLLMTAKTGIARHLTQLQFLLNLGPVREGERVIIQGVPWRVGAIYMFTQLTNPAMGGIGLRLPLEMLAGLTSRPSKLDEAWFPCENRGWVLLNATALNGSILAQVTEITPDHVEITYDGGLKRWIPTATFMTMDVASLSAGFTRSVTVNLPADPEAAASQAIVERLKSDLRAALLQLMRPEELTDLEVELLESPCSSLNCLITASFTGSQAPHYHRLSRVLRRAGMAG